MRAGCNESITVVQLHTIFPTANEHSEAKAKAHLSAQSAALLSCIRVDKVVPAQKVRDSTQLRTVAGRVVVELEERHSQQFHVFRNSQHLCDREKETNDTMHQR